MELYLDTANIAEIREMAAWGVLAGVTTNPSLVASAGRPFEDVLKEVTEIVAGPVSAEVTATETAAMLDEGRRLRQISPHVVVKLPITPAGLSACRVLTGEGHPVNMTLCFSSNQALLAARAGATYVSPFLGRVDDIGWDGISLVKEIREIFDLHALSTRIIAASIRHPLHVTQAALAGAHIATMPAKVFAMLFTHPLTEAGLRRFLEDWARFQGSK